MTSIGYPDGQRITQWLGAPVVTATALVIDNVLHTDGPFNLASWASVIVGIKPTGGSVTVTVRQKINGGPPGLELVTSYIVPAGSASFRPIVLFGGAVTLELLGSAVGTSVDYALYPSNSTTNAQVVSTTTSDVEVARSENKADVALPAGVQTTVAGPTTGVAWDGTTVARVEVFVPQVSAVAGSRVEAILLEDGAVKGRVAVSINTTTEQRNPLEGECFFTPAAGTHTYALAVKSSGAGTARGATTDAGDPFVGGNFVRVFKVL